MGRLRTKLYRFQREGVEAIQEFDGRALVADEMGLGKSVQALAWRDKYLDEGPTVVVCFADLKYVWEYEYKTHFGGRAQILSGRKPDPSALRQSRNAVYVVNYDILGATRPGAKSWVRWLKKQRPKLVVVDEIQAIKGHKTQRTRAVRWLCRGVPHVIGLGGTGGLELYPSELFPFLNIARPDVFPSFFSYAFDFCKPRQEFGRWTFKGATNTGQLHTLLRATVMIRRLKSEVMPDLPRRTQSVIPLDLSDRKEYDEAERDLIRWLWKKSKQRALRALAAERLLRTNMLKKLAAELKLKGVAGWLRQFLDTSNEKIIMFGIHKADVLHKLHAMFPGVSEVVTGDVTGKERFARYGRFNSDKQCRVLFGNLKAAGAGWSCKSASKVGVIEMPWNPALVMQARDRIHGVGRGLPGKQSHTYWFVGRDTIEERVCKVLQERTNVINQVLDGQDFKESNLLDLVTEQLMKRGHK